MDRHLPPLTFFVGHRGTLVHDLLDRKPSVDEQAKFSILRPADVLRLQGRCCTDRGGLFTGAGHVEGNAPLALHVVQHLIADCYAEHVLVQFQGSLIGERHLQMVWQCAICSDVPVDRDGFSSGPEFQLVNELHGMNSRESPNRLLSGECCSWLTLGLFDRRPAKLYHPCRRSRGEAPLDASCGSPKHSHVCAQAQNEPAEGCQTRA
mmetsp:Transcript_9060/g.22691  ORF Transcript_9060/g.22691 Transcript_9060/m.22691 type:complete len:207 (+) Transcript_9060:994-1614(+)